MDERTDAMTDRQPEDIRHDIEENRADMGETVDEIQNRLSPQHLREQAQGAVRDATYGRFEQAGQGARDTGLSVWETIKQNPLPASMIGIGLGWLYMSHSDSSQHQQQDFYPRSQGRMYRSDMSSMGSDHSASEVTESMRNKGEELRGQMQEQASNARNQAQYQLHQRKGQMQNMLEENPLAVGAIALGVGLAIGLATPETPQEQQMMGETRDQMMDQAQEKARDTFQRVENVAEGAQRGAMEEAEKQDLT